MRIVTLTLSPAFDLHCEADSFAAARENLAVIKTYDAGGKGVNISRALCAYGTKNTAIVILGEENGDRFADSLKQDGIDFFPIRIPGRIRENITVHVPDGKETRLSFRTADAPADLLARVAAAAEPLCEAGTILTLTGRVPDGISLDEVKQFVTHLQARGVHVVIDSRSFSLSDLIEVRPFLIKPNEEEIATYMGKEIKDTADALAAARTLHAHGIAHVMISLGGAGAVLVCKDGAFTAQAPSIVPLSTIGAGDSAIAGFLASWEEGKSPADCLRTAIAFGSAACLTPGTRPPERTAILQFLEQ